MVKKTGRTQTSYIREVILEHISNMEDLLLAHSVKERIANGEERVHTLDEVIRELGFEKKELVRRNVRKRSRGLKGS